MAGVDVAYRYMSMIQTWRRGMVEVGAIRERAMHSHL